MNGMIDWRYSQRVIKDTFALYEVPREALVIGMAGVLPYLATSLSTSILAWDINHAAPDGTGFLLSEKSAQLLLDIIEPLQIGYGAVVSIPPSCTDDARTADNHRSFLSWALFIGASNGPSSVAITATGATPTELSHPPLHGLQSLCRSNTHSSPNFSPLRSSTLPTLGQSSKDGLRIGIQRTASS